MKESRFVDGYLGYLLGQANHSLYKDFDARVRAAGLTGIEWRVLATLHDSGRSPWANWRRRSSASSPP
jgi:hypothetical protein